MEQKDFKYTQAGDSGYLEDEAYDIIRTIKDPEFPHSLEQLEVVDPDLVKVTINEEHKIINFEITWVPTTPTCGFALNIALCIRVKLERELSVKEYAKIDIYVQDGKHDNKAGIDR